MGQLVPLYVKAAQAAGEDVHSMHHSGHVVQRLPASQAEQRQDALAREEAREAEAQHRVVHRGGAIQAESNWPIDLKRLVSTLEPIR
jgi:hypothetical protein